MGYEGSWANTGVLKMDSKKIRKNQEKSENIFCLVNELTEHYFSKNI